MEGFATASMLWWKFFFTVNVRAILHNVINIYCEQNISSAFSASIPKQHPYGIFNILC